MASKIQKLRERQADSEKITINLGFVDLGHIDLLVREEFHPNRTDFIRTAIRDQSPRIPTPSGSRLCGTPSSSASEVLAAKSWRR